MAKRKPPEDENKVIMLPVKPVTPEVVIFPPPPEEPEEEPQELEAFTAKTEITKDNLVDYQESLLVSNARKILPALFKNLKKRADKLDAKAAEQIMMLYGYTKASNGVMVNILNNNVSRSESEDETYFEKIILKMEKHDRPDVIDITPEKP